MNFSLYYPVKTFYVEQGFGVNGDYYQAHGINIKGHNGLDLVAHHGQPVYAAHDGVAYYEIDSSGGHGVVIRSNDKYDTPDGQLYYKTIYWHLCNEKLEPQYTSPIKATDVNGPGQPVKAGDLIGYANSTGLSTGDHLHFGLKPMLFNEPPGVYYNYAQDNGYLGAIDPTPFFNGKFAQDLNPQPSKFIFTRQLDLYSFGTDVLMLQNRLVNEGVADFTPTGFFGPKTRLAVIAWQTKQGIDPVGRVGPVSLAKLNS